MEFSSVLFLCFFIWILFKIKDSLGVGGAGNSTAGKTKYKKSSQFKPIPDQFKTLAEVQKALRTAGLESSNLIIGVDYTKSNTWNGERSFGGRSLHDVRPGQLNPYQQVVKVIGQTLSVFDDDGLIPAYGFGDIYTKAEKVFPFYPDRPCTGFDEVLTRYSEITPGIQMLGPTNFGPIVREATAIVKATKAYHVLLIIADGQVDVQRDSIDAIVEASNHPLSIVCIGVGDGPWDVMNKFDDELPERRFDNFQFVDFAKAMKNSEVGEAAHARFAMSALMEIPDQFIAIRKLNLL
jgi:E3 ubiquitin-protein ligase RGLG